MRLYIVRHGKAERDSPSGREEDRRLRPRGERQARYLGAWFSASDEPPALLLASRYTRALDTAQIIQQAVGCEMRLEPCLELGGEPDEAIDLIRAHASYDPLMLVGHNPQLEDLVDLLSKGPAMVGTRLRTGEAACLELDVAPGDDPVGGADLIEMVRLEEEGVA